MQARWGRFVKGTEVGDGTDLREGILGEGILAEDLLQPNHELREVERFEPERPVEHGLGPHRRRREPLVPEDGRELGHDLVERRLKSRRGHAGATPVLDP